MPDIKVEISGFVDDSFPGWVECRLVDTSGRSHLFVEKVPVVSIEPLDARTGYPRDGTIACTVLSRHRGVGDREVVTVDTELPDGVESKDGESRFEILPEQLVERVSNREDRLQVSGDIVNTSPTGTKPR